jgi:sulfur-carrier protein
LITIKLLGGAKKAVGRSYITFNKPFASISEILTFLRENAVESKILNPNNILITINGADSALLSGNDTLVNTGDVVTIVTVVHGGMF